MRGLAGLAMLGLIWRLVSHRHPRDGCTPSAVSSAARAQNDSVSEPVPPERALRSAATVLVGLQGIVVAVFIAAPAELVAEADRGLFIIEMLALSCGTIVPVFALSLQMFRQSAEEWRRIVAGSSTVWLFAVLIATVLAVVVYFAAVYWAMSVREPSSFTLDGVISKQQATYLAATTLATLGPGDVGPATDNVRSVIVGQLFVQFVVLSVLVSRLLDSSRPSAHPHGTHRREVSNQGS